MRRTRWIVVGYDGSPASRAALRFAAQTARGRALMIVHAIGWLESDAQAEAVLDDILLEGNDELADLRWETRAVHGDPAGAILRVAGELEAEAIVVGSRARSGFKELLGSTSHRVLQHTDRPVTVITPATAERFALPVGP